MKRLHHLLRALLPCLFVWTSASGQQFVFPQGVKRDRMSFELIRNLIIIPVYIAGTGPYDFILDSGVGPMIITDSLLVETFDTGKMTTYTLQGGGEAIKVEAFFSNRVSAQVGQAHIRHIPTVFLKDDPFQISAYLGRPVHGIIGSALFHSFLIKVNYKTKRIRMYPFDHRTRRKGVAIPVELHYRKPYIRARILQAGGTEIPVLLLVDSGASHALSLETVDGEPFPVPEKTIPANLGIGLNGLISGKIGRIKQLELGRFELSDVLASYPDFSDIGSKIDTPERNGTLGAELLSRFKVTYDYRDSVIYLKKTHALRKPFEHDMSGLEIFVEYGNPDRYFISRIEPGSPAQRSGLRRLDEILSVNLKAVETLTLDDIYEMLKAGPTREVVLEIQRQDERLFKIVTLEKRI